jgi:hypothetical protein
MNSQLVNSIKNMNSSEKSELLDLLLEEFQQSSAVIEEIWIKEAENRLDMYQNGKHESVSYDTIIKKYQ